MIPTAASTARRASTTATLASTAAAIKGKDFKVELGRFLKNPKNIFYRVVHLVIWWFGLTMILYVTPSGRFCHLDLDIFAEIS